MMNVHFWKKSEKMFQIDLNSDLKQEPDSKSWCCFILFEPVIPGSCMRLNPNMGKFARSV